jgi:hypothetical protein
MTRDARAAVLAAALLLGGCGLRFGPGGFSVRDRSLFSQPPVVVHRHDAYVLAWTQGSYPFFFRPDYKAMDGRLVFALRATASSGSLAGRYQEMKIEGDDNIRALRRGGAWWWEIEPEPEGRRLWELGKPDRHRMIPLRTVEPRPTAAR